MEREFLPKGRDGGYGKRMREPRGGAFNHPFGDYGGPAFAGGMGRGYFPGHMGAYMGHPGPGLLGSHPLDLEQSGYMPMGMGYHGGEGSARGPRMEPPTSNVTKRLKPCIHCRKEDSSFRCGNCKMFYCSTECQKQDWIRHKDVCSTAVRLIGGETNGHHSSLENQANGRKEESSVEKGGRVPTTSKVKNTFAKKGSTRNPPSAARKGADSTASAGWKPGQAKQQVKSGQDSTKVPDERGDGGALTKEKVVPSLPMPEISLSEGTNGKCILTFYESPSKFWITLQESLDNVCELMEEMATLDDEPALSVSSVKIGDLIGVNVDKEWTRAHVIQISGPNATVSFLDYGNQDTIKLSEAKPLSKEKMKTTPPQALCCGVSKLGPKGSASWSKAAKEACQKWFGTPMGAFFDYTVKARKGSKVAVDLVKVEDSDTLANFLINEGFAEMVEDEPSLPNLSRQTRPAPVKATSPIKTTAPVKATAPRPMARNVKTVMSEMQKDQHFHCHVFSNQSMQNFTSLWVSEANTEYLKRLENSLLQAAKECELQEYMPEMGELVQAIHPTSDTWHRAEVMDIESTGLLLRFLDEGESDVQSIDRIRPITDAELKTIPIQALKCSLHGAEIPASVDPAVAHKKFDSLLDEYKENGLLMAVVKSKSLSNLVLDFESKSKPVSLSGALKKELMKQAKDYQSDSLKTPTPPKTLTARQPRAPGSNSARNLTAALDQAPQQTTLQTCRLPDSDKEPIVVSFVKDLGEFYVTLASSQDKWKIMDQKLNTMCESSADLDRVAVGCIGAAKFSLDKRWYRCRIERLEGNRAEVKYVDFGNIETVSASSLVCLPRELLAMPAQAIKCRMKGDLDRVGRDKHEELKRTVNEHLLATKVSEIGDTCEVQLFLADGSGTDIGMLLEIPQVGSKDIAQKPAKAAPVVSPRVTPPKPRKAAPQLPSVSVSSTDLVQVECVSLTSPQEFYVQLRDQQQVYAELMLKLTDRLRTERCPAGPVRVGDVVASLFSQDLEPIWYRVRVEKLLEGDTCRVFFLDYGIYEEVPMKGLKALSEDDFVLPPSTFRCELAGTQEADRALTDQFVSSAQTQIDSIKVLKQKAENHMIVDIYDHTGTKITNKFVKEKAPTPSVAAPKKPAVQAAVVRRLETDTLPEDDAWVSVMVTEVDSPSQLYVVRDEQLREKVMPMLEALNESPESLPKLDRVCVGAVCGAQFSQDNTWYRAVIENVLDADTCLVQFVDFGNSEKTSISGLKKLDPSYHKVPAQAIRCCLQGHEAGLSAVGRGLMSSLSEEELIHLKQHLTQQLVHARVVARRAGTYVVAMQSLHGEAIVVESQSGPQVSSEVPSDPIPTRDDLIDELPPEKTFEAVIHHCINATEFYCTRTQEFKQILLLSSELEKDVEEVDKSPSQVNVGEIYCCNFSGMWYRCVVDEVWGSTASISYIDFGNSEERPVSDLKILNPKRLMVPIFAIKCKLQGVTPKSSVDARLVTELWSQIENREGVSVTIEGEERDCLLVSASVVMEDEEFDLASKLVSHSIAEKGAAAGEEPDNIDQQMEQLQRQLEELKMKKKSKTLGPK